MKKGGFFAYMGAVQEQIQTQRLKNWTDLWFTENKKAGYVAVTDLNKHLFYGLNDVSKIINTTRGKESQYISINAFDIDFNSNDYSRETDRLKQIRNIAIDIDQYKLGMDIPETLEHLQDLVTKNIIPTPNLVLISHGIQLFYTIDKGASPDMSWLAGYITEQLISKMQHLGADSNAKDMSRVMRVPNSINERNNSVVEPFIWNDKGYTLQELQMYCRPLEKFSRRKQAKSKVIHLPTNKALQQFYKTNHARLVDLDTLLRLRKGDFTGMRNTFLYMYSYHQALVMDKQSDLLVIMQNIFKKVYSKTDKPMSKREFESTVKSAYKDAERFFNHFKDNGYRVIYKTNDGIKKPYKTSNVIDKLCITLDEQRAMRTLRNGSIAKEQHANYMRNKRRKSGTQSRRDYENTRKQQKQELMLKIIEFKKQGYSNKKIAEKLKISNVYVGKLVKEYKGLTGM